MNTTTAAIVSDSIAASSFDEDFNRGDYRRSASNVSTTTTIVTDPDSPVEDFDSPEEDEDILEEEDETSNGDGEDDGDTYEDGGAEICKCHDDDDVAYSNVRNDNDDIIRSTMMWHHVQQDQAGHEIDCEAFSSDSSEEEADDEEEFGDDDDDDEEGIELKEDEQQDEGDLGDSGDDGTDEHHDVDDIIIDEGEDDDDYGSSQEYETDEDSLDDANECDPTMVDVDNDDDGASSNASSSLIGPRPNHLLGNGASQQQQQHELFLPVETAPTIESLKYEEEDDDDESNSTNDSSSNEDDDDNDDDDDDDEDDDTQLYPQRTYIIEQNNRNSGRPRMWDGSYNAVKPPLPSISSSLSRSSSSLTSKKRHKFKESCSIANTATATSFSSRHRRRRSGVTFNNSVTVYPIFKTSVYTPTMILALYTQRDELRVNKLRNKREYAYEDYDWRNVVEEIDMTYSPSTGSSEQLVHPVHATTTTTTKDKTVKSSSNSRSPSPRNVVQTYSSAFGGYINGSSMTSSLHGAKRMRMYYP